MEYLIGMAWVGAIASLGGLLNQDHWVYWIGMAMMLPIATLELLS